MKHDQICPVLSTEEVWSRLHDGAAIAAHDEGKLSWLYSVALLLQVGGLITACGALHWVAS